MKNLLTLFTMLLLCIGSTWAQDLDRSGWTILASSACDDGGSGQVNALADGSTTTFWHSRWGDGHAYGDTNGGCPHAIQINLGSVQEFNGIRISNRTDQLGNGRVAGYDVYVSDTPFTTSTSGFRANEVKGDAAPVLSGTFTNTAQGAVNMAGSKTKLSGQYVLFVIKSSVNQSSTAYACIAEVNLFSIPDGSNAYIGTYNGTSNAVDQTKWQTEANWITTDTWNSNGPGYSESSMWSPIFLNGVTATGISFEGWNLRIKLVNSSLTATTNKLQTGSGSGDVTKFDVDRTSALDLTMSGTNGDPGLHTFNIDGSLTIKTKANHFSGSSTNTVNLGTTGHFTFKADDAVTIGNSARFTLNATPVDPSAENTEESRTLATFTKVTVSSLTVTIDGTDGWTQVASRAALQQQFYNGKYYCVEKNNSSGVTLYTFRETRRTTHTVTSNATLSDITYDTYDNFIVNSGVTLTVDVEDFDLTRITGAGNIVLAASTSLTGNKATAATGKLTVNAGKTLTIGSGDTQTNSVASFTSIDLLGEIYHKNSAATLNNVTVPADATGIIYSYDMSSAADGCLFLLAGTTTVNGTLFVCNKWNFQMKVDQLTGNGTWTICGTTASDFDADGTSSTDAATVNVASATSFTGSATVRNTNATVNVAGNLAASTWTKSAGTLNYTGTNLLDGTTLDGAVLAGNQRINTGGVVSIKNLAGNNLTAGTNNYALVGGANSTINLFGTCDFTKKSDGTTANTYNYIGYPSSANIVIKAGATVTTNKVFNSGTDNATVTIEEGATLITPEVYSVGISVTGDATLAPTATALNISAPVTVAAGKTLTINGGESLATVTIAQTPTLGEGSSINFVNTTIDLNSDVRDLSAYTFSGCTARFAETGAEYATGGMTITNIPSGVTVQVKQYGTTEYVEKTPDAGTVTLSHEVGVSDSAAWLDYTFKEGNNPTGTNKNIQNRGNAGTSNQNLQLDTNYQGNNSFNEDGTLKVRSTPYRDITWPTDYTVAVSANFPDVENGCLMAFGSSTRGSQNYLALIRGGSSDEIKLVKGQGQNVHFTEVATMSAENATASPHLVVFTKRGNVFNVYLDGVNVTQTTYSDALGTGFQVGSLHGGVTGTGLGRVNDMPDSIRNAIFAQAVRVYDYVISDAQMAMLKAEFPYISMGGSYSRTITADANLSASGAWYNKGTETNVDLPSDAEIEGVTYHPDVEITTSADATLTVNADMNARNVEFTGGNTLTIAGDETHHLKVYGSVTANSPVIVRYGSADFSTVPVSVGASGSIRFDFSAYDFSSVDETTQYVVTGNTSDYGDQITATYPADQNYLYTLAHNAGENKYILTVAPNIAAKQQQAIDAVTPYYNNQLVGTGVGKYTVKLGETSYREMRDFLDAIEPWTRLSDCVTPVITINLPESGKFYKLKGSVSNKYAYSKGAGTQMGMSSTESDYQTAGLFYFSGNNTDGFSILNYKDGYYVYNTHSTGQLGNSTKFTFAEPTTTHLGTLTIYQTTAISSNGRWMYDNGNNTTPKVDRNSIYAANNCDWYISEVTSIPVTFKAAGLGYATFNCPVAVRIPENTKAYVCQIGTDGNTLTFYEITSVVDANEKKTIPANTPVLLYNSTVKGSGSDVTVSFPVTTVDAEITNNSFVGTLATAAFSASDSEKDTYSLRTNTIDDVTKVGFYKKTSGTTLAGFKAWLQTAHQDQARNFTIYFDGEDDATGIAEALGLDSDKVEIYDLSGRKLSGYQKGINIVNGKKIFK